MPDYSNAVPASIVLDREPVSGSPAKAWDNAVLKILRNGTVRVMAEGVFEDGSETDDEQDRVDIKIVFASSRDCRQRIRTDSLKADLSEGGRLSVLISRIVAGHSVHWSLAQGRFYGFLTEDAEDAYLNLLTSISTLSGDGDIDMNWLGDDEYEDENEREDD